MNCCSMESSALQDKRFVLDHHIFDSQKGWTRAESMEHPTLRLRLSVDEEEYKHTGLSCPNVQPSKVIVVSDTGAMYGVANTSSNVASNSVIWLQSSAQWLLQIERRLPLTVHCLLNSLA